MIVFCVTLLLLHQGYALVPVTTVQLGESVTFTCVLPLDELSSERLYWYKQSVGDDLKLIAELMKHSNPVFEPEFSGSRLNPKVEKNISNLTILRTTEEDEGMYHCAVIDWTENFWSGTYLSLKERRMSPELIALVMAIICLVISLIGNIVFICRRTSRSICEQCKGIEGIPSQARNDNSSQPVHDVMEGGDDLNYAALHVTERKAARGRTKKQLKTEESVYSQVRF
ncbi:uncharacterized protein LOC119007105 [Acanthopagrus latus]|uniref:uncharacterized protein LOC119007105 n=1 Tax=Acanthopagrus latus TaxID=8177 RepID=UPI00187BF91B|nr:uncharacterized protein LOC119007105 [Acanthopagrus latus]